MTIKRQWMLVLILAAVLSVVVNSLILSSLINRYFIDYTTSNYNKHFNQIVEFSRKALEGKSYTRQQLEMQLEAHLSDPINRIKLYDLSGNLLADVRIRNGQMGAMMGNRTMNRMMGKPTEEIDSVDISNAGLVLGKLNITRYSSIGNSLETRMFTASLIINSLLSLGIVLVLVLVIGTFVSKRMSRDLQQTARQAIEIDLGNQGSIKKSKVKEIRTIQQSLEALQSKLKLKQTSRKKLIDELVHQVRTPLTILKTHLEGFEDGIINMSSEEIKTCESQIENITSIITNMSGLIDADKDIDSLKIEQFEFNDLLKQIVGGLKAQFNKKAIELNLLSNQKITMKTDQYKISQCIYNILTNAYKFTGPNGKVTVDYREEGEELAIRIEDTGAGIAEEDKTRLFDAYYRGKNTGTTSGEGIGLYVVKENLKRLNGSIEVESMIGKGSKFIIRVPKKAGV